MFVPPGSLNPTLAGHLLISVTGVGVFIAPSREISASSASPREMRLRHDQALGLEGLRGGDSRPSRPLLIYKVALVAMAGALLAPPGRTRRT